MNSFRLLDLKSLHQPAKGLWLQLPQLGFISRPLETTITSVLLVNYILIKGY